MFKIKYSREKLLIFIRYNSYFFFLVIVKTHSEITLSLELCVNKKTSAIQTLEFYNLNYFIHVSSTMKQTFLLKHSNAFFLFKISTKAAK